MAYDLGMHYLPMTSDLGLHYLPMTSDLRLRCSPMTLYGFPIKNGLMFLKEKMGNSCVKKITLEREFYKHLAYIHLLYFVIICCISAKL